MRNISDTISRLIALRGRPRFQPEHAIFPDRLSDLTGFGSNPGALAAKVYLPNLLPDAAPLVVVLHGCTQSAAGYDHGSGWSHMADQEGFALLFPEQQRSNNSNLCFNWFQPQDTARHRGEALSIRQMIETMVLAHGLDRSRIFVTGLSAGGAIASVMLATYPEVFAGGAIIAGLPYGAANTLPEAFDRMRGHGLPTKRHLQKLLRGASPHNGPWPSISIWHGSADAIVSPMNADAIVGKWLAVHQADARPARKEIVNGHSRQVLCGNDGRPVIEKYTISGMGHGTPLATEGKAGLGAEAPFMLDVGISSTRHIAHFWGIAPLGDGHAPTVETKDGNQRPAVGDSRILLSPAESPAWAAQMAAREKSAARHASTTTAAINKVITDALRSAGLMR